MNRTDVLGIFLPLLFFVFPTFAQKYGPDSDPFFYAAQFQQLEWRPLGPFRGGRSVAVAGVPGHPLVYYFGSAGGGLWKTTDGGTTWENISDGFFRTGSVGAIAVAPADPNVLYVGTGEHTIRASMSTHGDGVYKSMDGGRTWQFAGLPASMHIAAIRVHPHDPDIVYVAVQGAAFGPSGERGVYKSTDGGRQWRRVLFVDETTGACDLSLDPTNPQILYAGMWDHQRLPWSIRSGGPGSGIYKSTDGGESWELLTQGLPQVMGKVAVAIAPTRPNRIYANIEAAGKQGGVYRSDDGGRHWQQTCADRATVGRAWYYIRIVADPTDAETVYVLNAPLLRSIDGGRSFESIRNPYTDQHDLWINPGDPTNMILANDGGAAVTFNGGFSWSSQQNQPTGQFYRVTTDRRFPYFVYGGQQDNTTVAIASRTGDAGIDEKDWYPVAGCESAFLALDPDRPETIYGSCYHGGLTRYRSDQPFSKDVSPFPFAGLGKTPAEMRYRFNWNAPVVVSPHDPSVVYYAGNVVFRSEDEGLTWSVISPDLTRDDPSRQIAGGQPFTNEGAGGEVYNTISYLACSPHSPQVIWAGADDGLVHLTLDGGTTWKEVTPPDLGESLINAIEISPHEPGKVYLAATRHKFNDLQPVIYRTLDFGLHWEQISCGIDARHFVRVVREDPRRPGLLYAGTEGGIYLSFDDGGLWHRFQLNLPVCPVTDLTVNDNDLVGATMGRGFWILDDLGALQQSDGQLADDMLLFQPKPSVRFETSPALTGPVTTGRNPLPGMIIDYYLPRTLDEELLIVQILDNDGRIVRTYSNAADNPCAGRPVGMICPVRLPSTQGINRFYWDLREEPLPVIEGGIPIEDYRGAMVPPGNYCLRLIRGLDSFEQEVTVLPDPRLEATPEDFAEQQRLLRCVDEVLREIHLSVNRIGDVSRQLKALLEAFGKTENQTDLFQDGLALHQRITSWKSQLIQSRWETPQDILNFPGRLHTEFMDLRRRIDSHDPVIPASACQRLDDLLIEWYRLEAEMETILQEEVPAFNRLYHEHELPVLIVPEK